ncbi:MAG: FAD-dependent oxidoreductase [Oscillospiraceae bacterium]|jgi:2,4-dienoyl-CoA reductase-like NADH-dependent reductase (Old Yellow Enzyme family)/NADPH-dependent 2,4-dienoyl-CoA reductase/sulfur reductase-like enzyme|nr:FAD-dependent oxidoreductase [Oscillospiraceae bacterium]
MGRKYEHILRPIRVGAFTAKNRIEVSPAEPFLCTRDGQITPEFIAFTESMARGGAGIVTVGDSPVNQAYADENHFVVNLADPFIVHGLVRLADAIHRHGALASIELNLRSHQFPADMSRGDIRQVIQDFTDCAERCKKGGFDMVMLHGGHGHTVAQFYSPLMNKRADEYGASTFENRCRFANELLDSVRRAVGPGMAIDWRMSGDELTPGGVGIDEAVAFAKAVQDKLDLIHISAGNMYEPSSMSYTIQPAYMPMATNVAFAERFKRELKIPVTAVGSFNVDLAEDAVRDGKADVVAMIRQFIADPDCVNKAALGLGDEIRPCIRCCICTGDDPHGCPKPLRCSVNPAAGRNPMYDEIGAAPKQKKVVVVGGGAAGMEAARRAAERGYSVVLFEKERELGGSLTAAGANSLKGDVRRYADWAVHMTLAAPNIDVRLGAPAARDAVLRERPDAVIVASGSVQFAPDIPGIRGGNVCFAVELDLGEKSAGRRVVIIGAGLTGTETAVALSRKGHEVTLIDALELPEIDARGGASISVSEPLRRMADIEGVRTVTGLMAEAITDAGVIAVDSAGERHTFECDTVALSMGVRPVTAPAGELSDLGVPVYQAGDCAGRPGNIASAVLSGFYAATNLV